MGSKISGLRDVIFDFSSSYMATGQREYVYNENHALRLFVVRDHGHSNILEVTCQTLNQ